jgi:Mn-dependent DtxR family transcriptional regulator
MNDYPCFTCEPPLHLLLRRRPEEHNLRQIDVAESLNVSPEAVTVTAAAMAPKQ